MEKVFYSKELNKSFIKNLKAQLAESFKGCKKIAVKIHFGEPGNETAFKPDDVKPIIGLLKELNLNFFLYDSPVAYASPRGDSIKHKEAAIKRGWDKLGEIRTDEDFIVEKGRYMEYEVCKPLIEVDAVLVITHFKGHVCSGFGGAIKNLGMGALTKKSKRAIHDSAKPKFDGECEKCKACENTCPFGAITVEDYPVFRNCFGCSLCIDVCPNHCLKPVVAHFDKLLADGAFAAQKSFKKFYYVTLMKNITQRCDCPANSGDIIAKDQGILSSKDAVAIDKAAHDIITKAEGLDPFKKHNHKSGLEQVDEAERLGMGSSGFELVNLQI